MNNPQEAAAAFSRLGTDEQVVFLAALAHEVSMVARDTYEVGGDGLTCPARMRTINEIQHRLLGQLLAFLRRDGAAYPVEVLARIVLDHPADADLARQLAVAFDRAYATMRAAA